jgi:diphosphomevalonate decarboxylase
MGEATAIAHPNIAFIKYWGQADEGSNLPANASISMNLDALRTLTLVDFDPGLEDDIVSLSAGPVWDQSRDRVVAHLDRVRALAGIADRAIVKSTNNFPAGTGLASSASGFAALTLAATKAAGLDLDGAALSRLARLGSGSACRSVPGGFCLWKGDTDQTSYARQVAPADHWNLHDVVAIVSREPKPVGSLEGHGLAPTSPLHRARLDAVPGLLSAVREGIEKRDLALMGPAIEADALTMHGVMMTSRPSLVYWLPATVAVIQAVRAWRQEGLGAWFTMDAGPNVHVFCEAADAADVEASLRSVPGVEDVLASGPGAGVQLAEDVLTALRQRVEH